MLAYLLHATVIVRFTFSLKMVCFLSILAFYFTLIVQAKQDSTINGMNLQIFSFYITLRMQTSKQTSIFRKSVSKYPGIWGTLLQILSSGALCNISFHCAHDKMTLRENLTIESWGTGNYMTCRTPPSLFRLFANATHKINHARRNLTFTCKITPRVNFYYLL